MRASPRGRRCVVAAPAAWTHAGSNAVRCVACGLVLLASCPQVCRAGEAPDPLFWESEADFLEQVEGGQFVRRLELHLLEYAADPRWRSEWAARRYSGNGLLGEWGSTTSSELFVDGRIALNLFALERLQFRYDRREYQDGRYDVPDQRLDALWYAGAGWAFALTGWPSSHKEAAALGVGVRIGAARSRDALELRVVRDRFAWNAKSGSDIRFARLPSRLLADGFYEAGPWRVHGSVDLGLEYEATQGGSDGTPARSTRGFQRFADVEGEYAAGGWALSARVTGASLAREQSEAAGAGYVLDRDWRRAVLTLRRDLGRWSASALTGWASQREEFSSPGVPAGDYALDSLLWGVEGGALATRALALRLGYLGSSQRSERTIPVPGRLSSGAANLYFDKAHVRAVYTFQPIMSIELLLSQALRAGRFGGGSIKALLVF